MSERDLERTTHAGRTPPAPSDPAGAAGGHDPLGGRQERVADLGEMLRRARDARGLELGDLAELTHVRREYLRALEEGRYEDLPEDVYTRNFVRLYAQAVGLDIARTMETYARERRRAMGTTTLEERLEKERRGEPPPAPRSGPRVGALLPTLLLVVVVVGLALWGFNSLLFRPGRGVARTPAPIEAPPPAAATTAGSASDAADAGAASAPAGVVGGAAEARTVLVSIHSDPAGASVSVDGFALPGTTPIEDAPVTARSGRVVRVTLDGYQPVEQTVDLSEDRTVDVALQPVVTDATPAGAPAVAGGAVGPNQIGVTITEKTWLEVYHSTQRNQGERLVYATVDAGAHYVFDLPVYLHVGNAAGVHLDLSGQDLGAMGSSGAVLGRAFPAP